MRDLVHLVALSPQEQAAVVAENRRARRLRRFAIATEALVKQLGDILPDGPRRARAERLLWMLVSFVARERKVEEGGPSEPSGRKHPEAIAEYDDGSYVELDSVAGGAHPLGAWSELKLRFYTGDGEEWVRTYRASP